MICGWIVRSNITKQFQKPSACILLAASVIKLNFSPVYHNCRDNLRTRMPRMRIPLLMNETDSSLQGFITGVLMHTACLVLE